MITGVPAHVDGRMLDIAADAGVRLVNRDRMWHYTEGVQNWDPIWPGHGIRILPGPSSMWFDALGRRLPDPCLPGYDTLGTLRHLRTTPDIAEYDHSWFVLTQRIIEKEFALSGSEQNPDITDRDRKAIVARPRARARARPRRSRRSRSTAPTSSSPTTLEELVDEDERADRRAAARRRPRASGRSRRATCRSPTRSARTRRSRASATPAASSATGSAAPPRRTGILDPANGPADRGQAARPDPQDARRHPDRPRVARPRRGRPADRRASTPRARSPASAAAACTATTRSRAPSSAAASSPAGPPGGAAADLG